ncbi:sca1 complex scaffold protein scaa [Anaeramoeba flamelloides]|uniref:Sca1 complex scaffold protein scaa n=1 Tax=Anaeramoeba flamelloides TaxID=1746091 RepID=A0AAV8ADB2_9EUKA|nr:sca1 complex scaffold protein scaa [Anaeramoeba flamelloides]
MIRKRQKQFYGNPPYYVDSKGKVYDKDFYLVEILSFVKSKKPQDKKIASLFKAFPPFPKVDKFSNFAKYEKAVLRWRDQIQKLKSKIVFPSPVGHSFHRPYLVENQKNGFDLNNTEFWRDSTDSDSKSQNSESVSTGESTNPLNTKLPFKSSGDLSTVFPLKDKPNLPNFRKSRSFIPNNQQNDLSQRLTLNKHYTFNSSPFNSKRNTLGNYNFLNLSRWSNNLIPEEPEVHNYETFNEYESAYQRWSNIVMETTKIIPPHATDFGTIYGLITEEEKILKEKKEKTKFRRKSQEQNEKKNYKSKIKFKNFNQKKTYQYWIQKINTTFFHQAKMENYLSLNRLTLEIFKKNAKKCREPYFEYYNSIKHKNSTLKNLESNVKILNETKEKIKNNILKIPQIITRIEKYQSTKDIGIIHGTYPHQSFGSPKEYFDTNSLSCFSIRRKNLTGMMLVKALDCLPVIDNKKIQFVVPAYEDDKPIDLKKIKHNEIYQKEKESILKNIETENLQQHLNSWYYPTKFTDESIGEFETECCDFLFNSNTNSNFDKIIKVLNSNLKLDNFQKLLSEKPPKMKLTIFHTLSTMINIEIFKKIINYFFTTNNEVLHSKISYLLLSLLQEGDLNENIVDFIQTDDLLKISQLSYILNHYSSKHNSFVLYHGKIPHYSELIFEKSFYEIEKKIILLYYLFHIYGSLSVEISNKMNKVHSRNKKFIEKIIENEKINIKKDFENIYPEFIQKNIFLGINSRSISCSTYYLFLLITLLQTNEDCSIFNDINLLEQIQILSKSKFTHVRYGISRLWLKMIKFQKFREIIGKDLFANVDNIKNLIISKNVLNNMINSNQKDEQKNDTKNNKHNNNNNNNNKNNLNNNNTNHNHQQQHLGINLFSYLILKLFNQSIDYCRNIIIQNHGNFEFHFSKIGQFDLQIFEKNIFKILLQYLKYLIIDNNIQIPIIDDISQLLKNISKLYSQITYSQKIGKINQKKNKTNLVIIYEAAKNELLNLTNFTTIFEMILKLNNNRNASKSKLLSISKNFIQDTELYEKIIKNNKFFSPLYTFFRSNSSILSIKNAWKLIYKFNSGNAGAIKYFIDTNQMRTFVSLVSTGSHKNVVSYGLNTLYKLFELVDSTNRKKRNARTSSCIQKNINKDFIKSITENHHHFLDFFSQNSMFVNCNMLYKKYIHQNNALNKNNGLLYVNLAKIYYIILSKDYCKNILKQVKKKEQYLEGVNYFVEIICSSTPEVDWKYINPVGKGKYNLKKKNKKGWLKKKSLKKIGRFSRNKK